MITIEINGYKYLMNKTNKENLDLIQNLAIPNNWDAPLLYIGGEGVGKSTKITQDALYLDHKYNINDVYFTRDKFFDAIGECPLDSTLHYDEGITGMMSQRHAENFTVTMVQRLTQIRKKRIKFYFAFPYLHLLNKFFVSRALAMYFIFANGFTDRGYYYFYNKKKMIHLHGLMKGKYRLSPETAYAHVKPDHFGKFDKTFCLPVEEYERKKDEAVKEIEISQDKYRAKYEEIMPKYKQAVKIIKKNLGEEFLP